MNDIHYYASQGDIQGVSQQLDSGVDVDHIGNDGRTPLMLAAKSENADVHMIRFLIEKGADVNAKQPEDNDYVYGNEGANVLSSAIESRNVEKAQILLESGADVRYKRKGDHDALIDAMYRGSISEGLIALLRLLIRYGAEPSGVNINGVSPLRIASSQYRFDVVRMLLEAGADAKQLNWTELMLAVVFGDLAEVCTFLDDDYVDFWHRDYAGRTVWLLSLHVGDLAKAQLLLSSGANRDDVDDTGKTPLMYAVESGNKALVSWVIDEGFELNSIDGYGRTALAIAAKHGDSELVAYLVDSGATINLEQDHDKSALSYAAEANAAECISILLEHGADPNLYNEFYSAIRLTTNLEIARILLAAGADLNNISRPVWRGLTSVDCQQLDCSHEQYITGRNRRFGTANPEIMTVDFWDAMIRCGDQGYVVLAQYEPSYSDEHPYHEPIWSHDRFGTTISELPDGRIIEIGGGNADDFERERYIYNDVIVYPGDGTFTILGYPRQVFPPTDSHSATLVGDSIYIIGNAGYQDERCYSDTPVYRFCCTTYKITKVQTSGAKPGWISCHRSHYQEPDKIIISGGRIFESIEHDEQNCTDNTKHYSLDLTTFIWREIDIW